MFWFPHLLRLSNRNEMNGLVKGTFNAIGSGKVAMFISPQCGLNTLKCDCKLAT